MLEYNYTRAVKIIGPQHQVPSWDNLPSAETTRWVASRKAQVVEAVEGGLIPLDEALLRYRLSLEEFVGWQHAMGRGGVSGLRVAALQRSRSRSRPGSAHRAARVGQPVERALHPA